jgi:DNA-binding NtrC family response regulator
MSQHDTLILVVTRDEDMARLLSCLMKGEGFKTLEVRDKEMALQTVKSEPVSLVLLDSRTHNADRIETLRQMRGLNRNLPVIIIASYHDTDGALRAINAGAYDCFFKPFQSEELVQSVHQALSRKIPKQKSGSLSNEPTENHPLKDAMGPSATVRRVSSEVDRVSGSDFTVVIIGETGSGKELIARTIHERGHRSQGPFIAVDCGAIPETLLESELFGHEKGAFTGADSQKPGKFELANEGTLFLDEISNMSMGSQAKLLRVLQEKKVYRVGGTKPIDVDVRLLVASNQDLQTLVDTGAFRRDLFYRLNEFSIVVPPLRERREDIAYLAKKFLDSANLDLQKNVRGFSESAMNLLFNDNWPGNVRQLRSTIRRAALLADEVVTEKHLDLERVPRTAPEPEVPTISKVEAEPWRGLSLQEIVQRRVDQVEREVLTEVLHHTGGNKARAARLLQVDYKTIHQKLKKLGIWEGRSVNEDQVTNLDPETAESTEDFDLASTAQPVVLGVDVPQRWEQRRAPFAT